MVALPPGWPVASSALGRPVFEIVEGLFDEIALSALRREALSLAVTEQNIVADDEQTWRGGTPARHFLSSAGGPIQTSYFRSPSMVGYLSRWSGFAVEPSGDRGSYSFYTKAGDHLALHRDVESCEIAVITCLISRAGNHPAGGALWLYPSRCGESLAAIRRSPNHDLVWVHLTPGQSIVMRGGLVPHALAPLAAGQLRVVSILCYRAS